jgi:hypothetical protein
MRKLWPGHIYHSLSAITTQSNTSKHDSAVYPRYQMNESRLIILASYCGSCFFEQCNLKIVHLAVDSPQTKENSRRWLQISVCEFEYVTYRRLETNSTKVAVRTPNESFVLTAFLEYTSDAALRQLDQASW